MHSICLRHILEDNRKCNTDIQFTIHMNSSIKLVRNLLYNRKLVAHLLAAIKHFHLQVFELSASDDLRLIVSKAPRS